MFSQIYDSVSAMWIRLTPDGGTELTPDRGKASVIYSTQLDSYVRNYELEYLRNSLVLHECLESGEPV